MEKILKYITTNAAPNNILAGLIVGLYSVILCISFAMLFNFAPVSAYVTPMIGFFLIGTTVVTLLLSIFSTVPIAVAPSSNTAVAMLLVIALQISQRLQLEQMMPQLFPTLVASIVLFTSITGLCYFLFGLLRLGKLIRYIPFPVVAAFLASLGWIVFSKAILSLDFHFDLNSFLILAAAFFFVLLAFILQYYYQSSLTLIILFIATIVVFNLVLLVTQTPLATAEKLGWVIGGFSNSQLWRMPNMSLLTNINWPAIQSVLGLMVIGALVNMLSLLMNAMTVEIETGKDLDFNRELVVNGLSNVISSAGGGVSSHLSTPAVLLAKSLGGTARTVGLITAACTFITLFVGVGYLDFLPKFALFGIVIYLGASLLGRWLYSSYFSLGRQDYFSLVFIFLVITFFGFFYGVLAGIILSIILFIINYSKINVVKYFLTGKNLHSNKIRSLRLQRVLQNRGNQFIYFKLQGYIFFGTAYTLLQQIRSKLQQEAGTEPVKYIIFDLSTVNDLDSSAVQYFFRLGQIADQNNLVIILTNMTRYFLKKFKQENIINDQSMRVMDSVDHALEWCEEQLLADIAVPTKEVTFVEQLTNLISSEEMAKRLEKYFVRTDVKKDEFIIKQDSYPDGLYFIAAGEVSIIFEHPTTHVKTRLRKMGAGNVFGEMALYTHKPRSASTVADEDTVLYYLSESAVATMDQQEPEAAIAFHKLIIDILAERLQFQNHQLEGLEVSIGI